MGLRDRAEARWENRLTDKGIFGGGGGGPLVIETEAFIARSAQEIWHAMSDLGAQALTSEGEVHIEHVAGTGSGIGSRCTFVWHVDPPIRQVREITDLLPPTYLSETHTGGGQVDVIRRRWIEPTGGGCRVRWQHEYAMGALTTPKQRRAVEARLARALPLVAERWQRLLETGSIEPA